MFSEKFFSATTDMCTYENHVNAPYMRKEFDICGETEKSEITVTSTGFYQLFVNGQNITKGFLAPYITNPDKTLIYDNYDLSPYLTEGKNCIGFILGNGMVNCIGGSVWDFEKVPYRGAPSIAFAIEICYKNGDETVIEADETLKCAPSPITFDDLRCGVHYDANLIKDGWCTPGFDDCDWTDALKSRIPAGMPTMYTGAPFIVSKELEAVSIKKGKTSPLTKSTRPAEAEISTKIGTSYNEVLEGYIYDFGINTTGTVRLKINGKKGQKIIMQFSEYAENDVLDYSEISQFFPAEYAQRNIYICRGGEEFFEPDFTYSAGRYCLVAGLDEDQATKDALKFLCLNADMPTRGGFECSDEIANSLQQCAVNSNLSNLLCFPTDCPHREKNGWTGDAAMSCEQFTLNLGVEKVFDQWLKLARDEQRADGALPGIIPTGGWGYAWGNGPTWDSFIVELPYITYLYRGDKEILSKNADMIFKYLNYISKRRDDDGLVAIGLGDWCQSGKSSGSPDCPLIVTDSIMCKYICDRAEYIFDVLGLTAQKLFAKTLKDEFLAAIRKNLIDFSTMTVEGATQCGQAMALFCNVFEPGERREAYNRMVEMIHRKDDHFNCGMIGVRMIFHVLADFGDADLAYKMITRTDYPSYGICIKNGLTSLPELFYESYNGRSGSLNHHFMGDFSNFFITKIGGIRVNPTKTDCKRANIEPAFVSSLDSASAYYDTVCGKVSVNWKRICDDKIALLIEKPDDIKGKIILPKGYNFIKSKDEVEKAAKEVFNTEIKNCYNNNSVALTSSTTLENGVYVAEKTSNRVIQMFSIL